MALLSPNSIPPPAVSHLDADLSQGVPLDDLRAVVSDAGGVVEDVKEKDDNAFEIETNFPGDWSPWIDALHCVGDGDARRCPEYEIGVEVRAKSAAQARAAARKLQFKYLSTTIDGDLITFTRLDTTAGGVTRAHCAGAAGCGGDHAGEGGAGGLGKVGK